MCGCSVISALSNGVPVRLYKCGFRNEPGLPGQLQTFDSKQFRVYAMLPTFKVAKAID